MVSLAKSMTKNTTYIIKFLLALLPLLFPVLLKAQEGSRTIYKTQGRVISLSFSYCHKDSNNNNCEKHMAIMRPDSFLSEERIGNRLVASISGNYAQAYSKYFDKVYEIPDSDFDQLCRAEKQKVPKDQIYIIEIKINGQVKRYEIVSPKRKDVPRRLLNQFKKVEALVEAIRTTQNAYERKAIILNNQ